MSELSEKVAALEAELAELKGGREFWLCFDNYKLEDLDEYQSDVIKVNVYRCPEYSEDCISHWDHYIKVKIDG